MVPIAMPEANRPTRQRIRKMRSVPTNRFEFDDPSFQIAAHVFHLHNTAADFCLITENLIKPARNGINQIADTSECGSNGKNDQSGGGLCFHFWPEQWSTHRKGRPGRTDQAFPCDSRRQVTGCNAAMNSGGSRQVVALAMISARSEGCIELAARN